MHSFVQNPGLNQDSELGVNLEQNWESTINEFEIKILETYIYEETIIHKLYPFMTFYMTQILYVYYH